jgi:hypothetical protein
VPEAVVKGPLVTVGVLLGLLAATATVMLWAWQEMGDVAISGHGLLALGLGIGASLVVGVGLMVLIFFSHRRGYDDEAHGVRRPRRGDGET